MIIRKNLLSLMRYIRNDLLENEIESIKKQIEDLQKQEEALDQTVMERRNQFQLFVYSIHNLQQELSENSENNTDERNQKIQRNSNQISKNIWIRYAKEIGINETIWELEHKKLNFQNHDLDKLFSILSIKEEIDHSIEEKENEIINQTLSLKRRIYKCSKCGKIEHNKKDKKVNLFNSEFHQFQQIVDQKMKDLATKGKGEVDRHVGLTREDSIDYREVLCISGRSLSQIEDETNSFKNLRRGFKRRKEESHKNRIYCAEAIRILSLYLDRRRTILKINKSTPTDIVRIETNIKTTYYKIKKRKWKLRKKMATLGIGQTESEIQFLEDEGKNKEKDEKQKKEKIGINETIWELEHKKLNFQNHDLDKLFSILSIKEEIVDSFITQKKEDEIINQTLSLKRRIYKCSKCGEIEHNKKVNLFNSEFYQFQQIVDQKMRDLATKGKGEVDRHVGLTREEFEQIYSLLDETTP
ncbi:hypothetical protein M0811_10264 [Anaeramoeba ignava]|uniref:Uncharacterized protein n=1 Tax=Anaeramoeba ignava TaxID=1746090 RepID=A0A9Q0LDX4_ANAIG|nr:hypothetical protein M0811_10264 [Anaeramoeba ignava]